MTPKESTLADLPSRRPFAFEEPQLVEIPVQMCAAEGEERKVAGAGWVVWWCAVRCGATTVARADLQRPPHTPTPHFPFFPANLMTTSSSGETSPSLPRQLNVNQERARAAGSTGRRMDEGREGEGPEEWWNSHRHIRGVISDKSLFTSFRHYVSKQNDVSTNIYICNGAYS